MNRQTGCPQKHGGNLPGFTLIELMVVIVIIGILIAILVPAVGAVRRIAREAATKAVLQALETGLETYRAEEKIGGSYPPSFSTPPATASVVFGEVVSPYTNKSIPISGSGLLVWALSGADLLGTPGFRAVAGDGYWAESTGDQDGDLYHLKLDGQPRYARFGPYVETSKVQVSEREGTAGFVIPGETKARDGSKMYREYPMYLDSFGYPVLYWRADPAGRRMADQEYSSASLRGVYHWIDNGNLLEGGTGGAGSAEPALYLSVVGNEHPLGWDGGAYTPESPPPDGCFEAYVWNQDVQAKFWPHRADSYLLVSPGFDGLYGTADDIANFEHNGR